MAELELSKKMMAMPDKPWLLRGGMFDGEKLIALSLCEKCGETLIIHIEKALYSYAGAYPAMVQAEVAAFGDGCAYVNREDDPGTGVCGPLSCNTARQSWLQSIISCLRMSCCGTFPRSRN